jgi:hypothetical protein
MKKHEFRDCHRCPVSGTDLRSHREKDLELVSLTTPGKE